MPESPARRAAPAVPRRISAALDDGARRLAHREVHEACRVTVVRLLTYVKTASVLSHFLLIRPNGPTHPRAGFRHVTPEVRQTAASVASSGGPGTETGRRERRSLIHSAVTSRPGRSRWTDKSLTLRSRSSVKEKARQCSSDSKSETRPDRHRSSEATQMSLENRPRA